MKEHDDYGWDQYTKEYMWEIIQCYRDKRNEFFITDSWDRLHGNFKELYDAVVRLNPDSIFEVGCGGCYHLKNIHYLLPDKIIHGSDISISQITFGKQFSQLPEKISKNLFVMDIAEEVPKRTYELVYTQAVVMHQSTERATKMMQNMKRISSKYILMIENPNHHGGDELWNKMVFDVFSDCKIDYDGKYKIYGVDSVLITKP